MVSGLLLIAMMLIPNDMKPISDGTSRTAHSIDYKGE